MNILVIGGLVPWHPESGGGQIIAYKLSEALAKAGHRVDYVASATPELQRTVEWGQVYYVPTVARGLSSVARTVRAAEEREGSPHDVIHVHAAENTLSHYFSQYLHRVIFRHNYLKPRLVLGIYTPEAYALPRSFSEVSWMLLCRTADRILALSDFSKRNIAEAYRVSPSKISVVYGGVDAAFLAPRRRRLRKPRRLIFCGRLAGRLEGRLQQKGLDTLLKAMPAIIDRHQVELEIVGSGPLLDPFQSWARQLGLEEHVKFSGFVEHQEMPRHYREADLLVLPSRRESFGLVLAEAMAAGLPVVATRAGAIPEVVEDAQTGILVPPGDPRALAGAINDLLDDPARMEQMGANGKERVERLFTWDKVADRVVRCYLKIL